jgi:CubicO group peptidase (beta-lactamase class C family)
MPDICNYMNMKYLSKSYENWIMLLLNGKLTITILLLTLTGNMVTAQTLQEKLAGIAKANDLVGMSVCVVQSGKPLWLIHEGYRDLERKLPVNDSIVFRIASISKMFTVTAIMQLYDRKLFRLTDDVSPYLGFKLRNPDFPDQKITFEMLMSHTSSLREGEGYEKFLDLSYGRNAVPSLQALLVKDSSCFTADMWSKTDGPDQHYFSYANINFGILGTLVELISGQRFDLYCLDHIFKPLHLTASFDVRDIPNINNVSVIYRDQDSVWTPQTEAWRGVRPTRRDLSTYKPGTNAVIFSPQGGLRISASDLAKFMVLQENNGLYNQVRILSDSSTQRMHQIIWQYNGTNGDTDQGFFLNYGLASMNTDNLIPGMTLTGHSGDAYGLISDMYYSPKEDFGIIFITNGGKLRKNLSTGWYTVEEEIYRACYQALSNLNH